MRGVFATTAMVCLAGVLAHADDSPSQVPCAVEAPGGQWSDAARWIAGQSAAPFSTALTPDQRAAWNDFSHLSAAEWSNLKRQYLNRIDAWRAQNLPTVPAGLAFYPFGGPDAANLLAFYPDAREYMMIGLEPVGCVPTSIADYTPAYFAELRQSLSTVVAMGFFKTDDMRRDITQSDLNGVLPLLVFLISRSGYTIDGVTSIGISPAGAGPLANIAKPEVTGVAIHFSDAKHGARTLRYFSMNLENSRLRRRPGVTQFLRNLPDTVTLVKAASYLMHKPYFSSIRSTILAKSRVVIEDDSGIPYHYFDPAAWNVRLFGTYSEPIQMFKDWSQDDLKAAYDQPGVPPLDFGLGYRHLDHSNLLLAVRKTK